MKPKSLASRLFNRNTGTPGETQSKAKYERQVDCLDHQGSSAYTDSQQAEDNAAPKEKCHREIHFAFLPERYEPLIENEETHIKAKEEKRKRKKEKYNKVKKNVGKALRSSWKCLMLGLYNFALGYSTPISAAATFVPDFHPGRTRG
ncbi:required for drug-induced death protein 1-like [Centroberyx affinis]|uniref:required for drug-induced death protein 1-like n=1 Tax=Centroberyx affinis TaxID=166261 RepID=UPI003A5C631E